MKILVFIILMTYYFGGIKDMPVTQEVVSSPEQAAIILWKMQESVTYPEPKSYVGHLYEIDLDKLTVKEIDIPKISFQQPLKPTSEASAG